ncbi:flagellar basal body-associated FliL family protein [Sulfuriflexus mobilis]|uniref:flagellar basal body-associated FliL family protein n=1 Tax=Sulfuriflexus mobilis TaxID=1811807 RepID=UPI000F822B33|nr:flagellar basal body-associated FliL family protein [Sulfuriflexus mobilis]
MMIMIMYRNLLALFLLFLFTTPLYASSGGSSSSASPYLSFQAPFVVNITDKGRMRFLQVAVQLKLADPNQGAELLAHEHALRHYLIMLLSDQEASKLYSVAGKEALRKSALQEIKKAIKEHANHVQIEDIFFTSFIIQ